jgi:hypothetical protein
VLQSIEDVAYRRDLAARRSHVLGIGAGIGLQDAQVILGRREARHSRGMDLLSGSLARRRPL